MALVSAPSPRQPNRDPTSSLQDALKIFASVLPQEKKTLFQQQNQNPADDDVISLVAKFAAETQRSTKNVAPRVCTFLIALQQFVGVVDTFVSSNRTIAALVWGSVKAALQVAGNAAPYFDKVTSMIMEVGRKCPTLEKFQSLYPGCVDLQATLCDYYAAIIRLLAKVVEVNQRRGPRYVWSIMISSFEAEFNPDLKAIDSALTLVDKQIELAFQQAMIDHRNSSEASRWSWSRLHKELTEERKAAELQRLKNAQEMLRTAIKDNLTSVDFVRPWKPPRGCGEAASC